MPETALRVTPYWSSDDGALALYLGDCREVLPALSVQADLIVADPPYGETSLTWDRWPIGWPALAAQHSRSMWCFGSMRMYLDHAAQFAGWRLSQDIIWDKGNGTGLSADRFRRVHEIPTHWYRGRWGEVYKHPQRVAAERRYATPQRQGRKQMHHLGGKVSDGSWIDDGTRMLKSILSFPSVRGGIHPTEKPVDLLLPLISYGCPPDGLVVDPFAGSGSTLAAAAQLGVRATGIEADERYAEAAARRLEGIQSQPSLFESGP